MGNEEQQQPDNCNWETVQRVSPTSHPASPLPSPTPRTPSCFPEETPLSPSQCPLPFLKTKPKTACSERKDVNHRILELKGTLVNCLARPLPFVKYSSLHLWQSSSSPFSLHLGRFRLEHFSRSRRKEVTFHLLTSFLPLEAAASSREGYIMAPQRRNDRMF